YGTTSPETIQQIHKDMLALDALLEYTRDPSVKFAPDDVYIRLFERFYKHAHLSYTKRLIAGEHLTRAENEVAVSQYYIDLFKERKDELCRKLRIYSNVNWNSAITTLKS